MGYTKLKDIPAMLGIKSGDKVLVSSAMKDVIRICRENDDDCDLNVLIDAFQRAVGEKGLLIFPTYNWDWCKGGQFDYRKSPSSVGALSQIALERADFKRTKHPIYSFAVWGADRDILCNMDNKSAFGEDSPFRYFYDNDVINIVINCLFWHSFTFVHYVEERNLENIHYRYLKDFRASYIDEDGNTSEKVFSMCVRSYFYQVKELVDDYEEDWIKAGAQRNHLINGIKYALINLRDTYPIIEADILKNRSRHLCSYKGQEEGYIKQIEAAKGLYSEIELLKGGRNEDLLTNILSIVRSYEYGIKNGAIR